MVWLRGVIASLEAGEEVQVLGSQLAEHQTRLQECRARTEKLESSIKARDKKIFGEMERASEEIKKLLQRTARTSENNLKEEAQRFGEKLEEYAIPQIGDGGRHYHNSRGTAEAMVVGSAQKRYVLSRHYLLYTYKAPLLLYLATALSLANTTLVHKATSKIKADAISLSSVESSTQNHQSRHSQLSFLSTQQGPSR